MILAFLRKNCASAISAISSSVNESGAFMMGRLLSARGTNQEMRYFSDCPWNWRMARTPFQQGRSKRKAEAYSTPDVEALSDARMQLEGFGDILISGVFRRTTRSRHSAGGIPRIAPVPHLQIHPSRATTMQEDEPQGNRGADPAR